MQTPVQIIFLSFVILTSCSGIEQSHKEKINLVVETYVSDLFKSEPILEQAIDSLNIITITEKKILEEEAFADNDKAFNLLNEAKEIGEKYQETRDLVNLIETYEGENDASSIGQSSMRKMKGKAEKMMDDAKKLYAKAKETAQKSLIADSVEVIYYKIIASGSITSLRNVQKRAVYYFHISKDPRLKC